MLAALVFAVLGPPALIGAFVLFHLFRPSRPPADASNVINRIRLLWFTLTRPELFVGTFPWLRHDELTNVTGQVHNQPNRTVLESRL